MIATFERPAMEQLRHDFSVLRGNWLWFVLLGVGISVLGFIALGSVVVASLATAMVIGVLLMIGGFAEAIGAFWSRAWSGFLMHMLCGVLSIVVGLMFLRAPVDALIVMTLLLACLLMASGFFRIIAALTYRFAGWGWPLAGGVVDLLLGVMILFGLPESAFWVIGLYVGISLLFRGANWIAIGLALRSLPVPKARWSRQGVEQGESAAAHN